MPPQAGPWSLDALDGFWGLDIAPVAALLRLGAALLAGFVIGLDREIRDRPAGLRTNMMVALAACAFTLIAFSIYGRVQAADRAGGADPLRLLEAITAGVAFLAAGAILMRGEEVHGLTTGAGLWLSGALGMACGLGLFGLAALATILAIVVLTGLHFAEEAVKRRRRSGDADGSGGD